MLVYWRAIAALDFGLAGFNVFMAWFMWNWVSYANLLAAVVCAALGVFAVQRSMQIKASRAEEARIQAIRDNWPWN